MKISMQQPELGRKLTALRKEKNLTQEELVEKSHVSVRTIQRIEAGEVLPRISTVKILLEALGEHYEPVVTQQTQGAMKKQKNTVRDTQRNLLLMSVLAGPVYLICEVILGAMDIQWIVSEEAWKMNMNAAYIGLTVLMVISYTLFVYGFVVLSNLFENTLLKVVAGMLMVATTGKAFLDVVSLFFSEPDALWLPYAVVSVLFGALSIVFGVALLRLQDGMGVMARMAGILEIMMGCLLVTVILFFFAYIMMVPAVVVEILVLYRAYEYLSRSEPVPSSGV